MNWLDDIIDSMIFFSRLPLRRRSGAPERPLAAAARGFAVAGALIGAVMAAAWLAVQALLPGTVLPVIAALVVGMALTGALHEDGLADVADGFGGGGTRQRKLDIMRDSRTGAYGVLALLAVQGAMVAGYAELAGRLPAAGFAGLLVAIQSSSRAVIPIMMRRLPSSRGDGRSHDAGCPDPSSVVQGLAVGLALCVLAGWMTGIMSIAAMLPAGIAAGYLAMHALAARQIGGQTGDVLGATQQVSALLGLLAVLLVAG